MDPIADFQAAMRAAGLEPQEPIIADGKLHRFAPVGCSRDDKRGFYQLHLTPPFPAGFFGSWGMGGEQIKWSAKIDRELTLEEKTALKKRIEADRKRKQRLDEEIREEAKRKAEFIWKSSEPCSPAHPYLVAKQIKAHEAREWKGSLVNRVVNDGYLVGLQFIKPDGEKRYLTGTNKVGSYVLIGDTPKGEVVVCEGYATGASIHEATGIPVLVAFDAGNLEAVAKYARAKLPESNIIIAADEDRWTKAPIENPGVHFASKAAAAVGGQLRRPNFRPGFEGKPTDFNDLARLYGPEEVRLQITGEVLETAADAVIDVTPSTPTPSEHAPIARQVGFSPNIFYDTLPNQHPGKKPKGTLLNLQEILRRIGATVRYNVITKREEVLIAGRKYTPDNQANAVHADVIDACVNFEMPTANVLAFITKLADNNPFNPVATWITDAEGKSVWDGVSRLQAFYDTVTAKGEVLPATPTDFDRERAARAKALKETLMRRWCISAIAAAFDPRGVSAHGVLVFQGDQYLGKTKWFKSLAPEDMGLLADGLTLNPQDKDSVGIVVKHWIVELGELDATFRKADIANLKAFITKRTDIFRRPYATRESEFPRRTVFFASVNDREFLSDPTGNRRFWTIACEKLDHSHALDMRQVWAEFLDLYRKGESHYLTAGELDELNLHNTKFLYRDPIEERVHDSFDWHAPLTRWRWTTITKALRETGLDRPTRAELYAAGNAVRKMPGHEERRANGRDEHFIAPYKELPF